MGDALAYAAISCRGGIIDGVPGCGPVDLTLEDYERQMDRPNRTWVCPRCGGDAEFDDARFEQIHGIDQDDDNDDNVPGVHS